MLLEGKVAIVTASTRGIGRATVDLFAKEGATVYMAARNEEKARDHIAEVGDVAGKIKYVYNDATKPETYKSMVDEVVKAEGRLDVLVNNFGTSDPRLDRGITTTDVSDFLRFLEINVESVFLGCQAALVPMKEQRSGSIINMSSVGGQVADISQIAYSTSKAAIDHLTRNVAVQSAPYGVRCNVVAPGMTATDAVMDNLTADFQGIFMKNTPMGRMAEADEMAHACLYFASDGAAYTTGQILQVTGGFGLATPIFGDLSKMLSAR